MSLTKCDICGERWVVHGTACKPKPPSELPASNGSAAVIQWLKTEMLEDEGAMIYARDAGDWNRYHRLEGHKDALLHVVHHLRADQHRPPAALEYAKCDLMNAITAIAQGRLKDAYMEAQSAQRKITATIESEQQNDV